MAPNAVESAGLAGVTAAFRSVVHASLPERRDLLRRSRGVLLANAAPIAPSRTKAAVQTTAAATAQNVTLGVDSDECATFYRNGIAFDQPCGYGPGRGIDIVVVNQITGEIEVLWSFDTWIALNETAPNLEQYIAQILPERLVLIANADANDLHELYTTSPDWQQSARRLVEILITLHAQTSRPEALTLGATRSPGTRSAAEQIEVAEEMELPPANPAGDRRILIHVRRLIFSIAYERSAPEQLTHSPTHICIYGSHFCLDGGP